MLCVHDQRATDLITYGILNGEIVEGHLPVSLTLVGDDTQSVVAYPSKFM